MNDSATMGSGERNPAGARRIGVKALVGSGDRIGMFVLPFLAVGLVMNILRPEWFSVGGPPPALQAVSAVILTVGVAVWLWSAVLILTKVPKHELITSGPFALVKHPLYTGVSLLVIPWLGFLLNSWLGVALGAVLYVASRQYAPAEERILAEEFGGEWERYSESVMLPWL